MKATINNITFEGTPAEFAEFIQLQTPKTESTETPKYTNPPVIETVRPIRHQRKYKSPTDSKISVLYKGNPIGTMTMTELSSLLDIPRETIRGRFTSNPTFEHNGYKATLISLGIPRGSYRRLKATDTKGDNRIYNSIIEFCMKTKTSRNSFNTLRKHNPNGPWKINGYIVEKIN